MRALPNLTGVPETMLWTLYNRAMEAKRADRILDDPECVRIFDALEYDFPRNFGDPDPAHAVRAVESDQRIRTWMAKNPGGTVVSLGEGLDTQALRVDDGRVQWVTVDVPEAIEVRSKFLPATDRRRHVPRSALDHGWMDEVDASKSVFVVAQGLFMYFQAEHLQRLIAAIAERFPGTELFFDAIPRWFSARTMKGAKRTPHYTLPPMPWGIDIPEVEPFLRGCTSSIAEVTIVPYRIPRGWIRVFLGVMRALPGLQHKTPTMVHVRFAVS